MWSRVSVLLSIGGGLCGIAALLLFFYLIPVKTMVSAGEVEYIYARLSLHMWFLEMILLIVGLAAALLGIIGYQSVKEGAVERAKQEVQEYLRRVDRSSRGFDPVYPQEQPEPLEEEV